MGSFDAYQKTAYGTPSNWAVKAPNGDIVGGRRTNVINATTEANLNVLAVQECTQEMFNDLQGALAAQGFSGEYAQHGGGKEDGVAIFYKSHDFTILNSIPQTRQAGPNGKCTHLTDLRVILKHTVTQKTMQVATAHLRGGPNENGGGHQLKGLLDEMNQQPKDVNVVLGDFNRDQNMPNDRDPQLLNGPNPFRTADIDPNSWSEFNGGASNRQLDKVFYRGDGVTDGGYSYTGDDPQLPSYLGASTDHLLISMGIKIPPQQQVRLSQQQQQYEQEPLAGPGYGQPGQYQPNDGQPAPVNGGGVYLAKSEESPYNSHPIMFAFKDALIEDSSFQDTVVEGFIVAKGLEVTGEVTTPFLFWNVIKKHLESKCQDPALDPTFRGSCYILIDFLKRRPEDLEYSSSFRCKVQNYFL